MQNDGVVVGTVVPVTVVVSALALVANDVAAVVVVAASEVSQNVP